MSVDCATSNPTLSPVTTNPTEVSTESPSKEVSCNLSCFPFSIISCASVSRGYQCIQVFYNINSPYLRDPHHSFHSRPRSQVYRLQKAQVRGLRYPLLGARRHLLPILMFHLLNRLTLRYQAVHQPRHQRDLQRLQLIFLLCHHQSR